MLKLRPCSFGRVDRRSPDRSSVRQERYAFMHSLRAFAASALAMPLVLALHSAILLGALAGFALRHWLTKFCRSLPSSFFSPACAWQLLIFVFCAFSAAMAGMASAATNETTRSERTLFMRTPEG